MAKQEKEIERWVTVNGARVPIFKDGSIGGPKALRDKIKANQKKKSSSDENTWENRQKLKKEIDDYRKAHPNPTAADRKKVNEMRDKYDAWMKEDQDRIKSKIKAEQAEKDKKVAKEKKLEELQKEHYKLSKAIERGSAVHPQADKHLAEMENEIAKLEGGEKKSPKLKEASPDIKKATEKEVSQKKIQAMQEYGISGARNLSQLRDKLRDYGVGMESADMADIERDARFMNGEKVSLYDKAGNEYRGTFNKYRDGGMEIVDIKKEWYNRKPTDTHPTGVEDNDTKEKQISRNKKEADDRNNQVSDRVKSYQDKFLKKRSVEEIKEIQSNIEKSGSHFGYTESDMVAMRAIENELKERSGKIDKNQIKKNFGSTASTAEKRMKEYDSQDLKEVAEECGFSSSQISSMSMQELKAAILAIYKRK